MVTPQSLDEKDKGKQNTPTPTKISTTGATNSASIQIYKPTGELQCQPGSGLSIEKNQSLLTKANITIMESSTQNDGLMHMSVCGTPKGQIHVFKIPAKFKGKALKLGFKQWEPKSN